MTNLTDVTFLRIVSPLLILFATSHVRLRHEFPEQKETKKTEDAGSARLETIFGLDERWNEKLHKGDGKHYASSKGQSKGHLACSRRTSQQQDDSGAQRRRQTSY